MWSPDAQVVHGIPTNTPLEEGSILSIDCGALKNGFMEIMPIPLPSVLLPKRNNCWTLQKPPVQRHCSIPKGTRVGDVGHAIQSYCEAAGYGVVRELVGHGLGREMHEAPEMPNYGRRGRGKRFQEGLVVAIEPMINRGTKRIKQLKDGWTILTADGQPSAHFEHNVALLNGRPQLLSTFQFIYEALGIESDEETPFEYTGAAP